MLTLANSTNKQFDLTSLGESRSTWPSAIRSANDWFSQMFPVQIRVFGSPFLEETTNDPIGGTDCKPLVPNLDCLAACLGGDNRLGHRVIYYPSELQFYFYDPRTKMYHATTSEKVGNLLRGLLVRCASEVKGDAHLFNLFHTFRADAVVKAVVNRCKSILSADPDFFGVSSPHQRVEGPEIHERLARVFAEQLLEPHEGSILTVSQTYTLFNKFAKTRNMPDLKRNKFKSMMVDVIRDAYGLGVRNDLVNGETETQQCGWRGLRPVSNSQSA